VDYKEIVNLGKLWFNTLFTPKSRKENMSAIGNFTVYDPNRLLPDQVEPLSKPEVSTVNTLVGVPYTVQIVQFKPLKIGDKLFNFTFKSESAVDLEKKYDSIVYDKFTYFVKSVNDDSVDLKEIPVEQIENKIKEIYQSILNKNSSQSKDKSKPKLYRT
jgi:hypothetical protein